MRLVIISLDAVFAADAEFLLSLPNLGELAGEGVFCERAQTIYPSLTYPIHVSLLTGCYPDRHGVGHNEPFNPHLKSGRRPWYWDERYIQVETLFSQASCAGRDCAALLWPVTGHSRHIRYNLPEALALPGENQVLKALRYGSTGWLLRTELAYGRRRRGKGRAALDDYVTLLAETLIARQYAPGERLGRAHDVLPAPSGRQKHMPDILALHLAECDEARHRHGTFSSQAREALERLDTRVGRVLEALRSREAREDTVVCVVSDHGHADVSGTLPLDAWLAANRVPARAQTLGLGAYLRLNRGDYHPVLNALRENMEQLRIRHVYTREELRGMNAPEDVLLAVEPEECIEYVDDENALAHAATHGFGPDHPAAQCLLWLSGPMFRRGARLPACNLVDVAPTLARAAGLSLPQAQGRVLEEAFDDA